MSAASAAFLNGCAIGRDREDGPSGDLAIPQFIDRADGIAKRVAMSHERAEANSGTRADQADSVAGPASHAPSFTLLAG